MENTVLISQKKIRYSSVLFQNHASQRIERRIHRREEKIKLEGQSFSLLFLPLDLKTPGIGTGGITEENDEISMPEEQADPCFFVLIYLSSLVISYNTSSYIDQVKRASIPGEIWSRQCLAIRALEARLVNDRCGRCFRSALDDHRKGQALPLPSQASPLHWVCSESSASSSRILLGPCLDSLRMKRSPPMVRHSSSPRSQGACSPP